MQYSAVRENGVLTITYGADDFAQNNREKANRTAFSEYARTKAHYEALKDAYDSTDRLVARTKAEVDRAIMPEDKRRAQEVYDSWVKTLEDGKADLDAAKEAYDAAADVHGRRSINDLEPHKTITFQLS
jgi:hypothetical protein